MRYSVDPTRKTNGLLGEVDINRYPENIRQKLARLKIDEFTESIKYGDLYVIFKRMKK